MDVRPDRFKVCSRCNILKRTDDFYVRVRDGCQNRPKSWCKECEKEKAMQWARENREKANQGIRDWRMKYPDRERASCKRWKSENKDRVRMLARKNSAKRRSTGIGKLHGNVSCLVYQSLKNNSKSGRCWESLVGYTVEKLKQHLEKQFKDGMSWDNYGKWHIDHKIPVSVFNFEKPEDIDFKRCWELKNLQPLWAVENILKRNKIDKPFQPSLAMGGAL